MSEEDKAVVRDAVERAERYQRRVHRAEALVMKLKPLRPRLARERRSIIRDAINDGKPPGNRTRIYCALW